MQKQEYLKMFSLENKHFWFIGKRLFIKAILDKYCPVKKMKVLDIVCGTGGLTVFLKKYGDVIGLEINPVAINLAKTRKLKIIQGDAQKLPFTNHRFDLITVFDVLYHKNISDENKVLTEIRRVLKPHGLLIITDSAFNFLNSKHDFVLHGNKRFSINYLTQILTVNNFKVLKSSYCFFSLFPLVLFKRKILNLFLKESGSDIRNIPNLINNLLIKILSFEACLLKRFRFPFGSSLIIVAQDRDTRNLSITR